MSVRFDLAREAKETTKELETVLASNSNDEKRVFRLVARVGDLRARELKRLVDSILVVRKTLTANQFATLRAGPWRPKTPDEKHGERR